MESSISTILLTLSFFLLLINPAITHGNTPCGSNVDVSRIPDVPVDENAKYVTNEIEIEIDRPVGDVFKWTVYTPLEIQLRGTKKIPGVRSTKALNNKKYGEAGYRRLVCLEDGNSAVEEIIDNILDTYFSYKVWNYSLKTAESIEYAKGEWWFTPSRNKTHIRWRYSFKLKKEEWLGKMGPFGRWIFTQFFINAQYDEWMNETLRKLKTDLERS
jgi:hypothetical protein